MKNRISIFAKGNVDVHDSLHSCVIGGQLHWNGINDILRKRYPGTLIRLKHETFVRSDALLAATGEVPSELANREVPLGPYPAPMQFSTAIFDFKADVYVLSMMPDVATCPLRHKQTGFMFYPNDVTAWPAPDRDWLRSEFESLPLMDVQTSIANTERVIDKIREKSEAPILIYNMSPIVPGPIVHCLAGLDETFAMRIRRFNLALAELSERTGISIIDVDEILARAGADALKVDAMHLAPDAYRLIAEEVVRVLEDLYVIEPPVS